MWYVYPLPKFAKMLFIVLMLEQDAISTERVEVALLPDFTCMVL